MKRLIQTLFFFLLVTQISFAQWYQQYSGTTMGLLGDSFTDANTGTVVGYAGTIIRTTDGGNTWTSQTSGTINDLYGVAFTDADTGTAVGENGTILRTTNGGTTWTSQTSPTGVDLRCVSFTDANTGNAVGSNVLTGFTGTILRTTDGGNTWTSQIIGGLNYLYGVSFTDANNGTAVGEWGTILRTTNGGTDWILQTSGTEAGLFGVSFTDADTGTAVGFDYGNQLDLILHTTNGGVPVELTSFTASAKGKEIILNWSTATELNNQGFEIQRSTDGEEFFTVGFVNGHGTTTEQQNYSYSDKNLDNGKYFYRLKQVDYDGSFKYSDVVEVDYRGFNSYLLEQNYPNPFNPNTKIKYSVPQSSNVMIKVFDVLGNEIETLVSEEKPAGTYELTWNAVSLPSGVYFYQLKAGSFLETKKMLLLK